MLHGERDLYGSQTKGVLTLPCPDTVGYQSMVRLRSMVAPNHAHPSLKRCTTAWVSWTLAQYTFNVSAIHAKM